MCVKYRALVHNSAYIFYYLPSKEVRGKINVHLLVF